jgi:tetratricopeptide (TPR) repeat protein
MLVFENTEEKISNFFELDGFPLISLENLEGNYIEEYTEENIKRKQATFQVSMQFLKNPGLPARSPDPRTGVFGSDFSAVGFYSAGVAFFQKNEFDKAIANFTQTIKIKPNHFYSYKLRGLSFYEKNEIDKSISDFTNAINLDPINTGFLNKINIKNLSIEDYEKIITGLAETYSNRGNAFDEKGEYELAINDYTEAIKIYPNCAEAYNNRGFVYMNRKNDLNKAISDYEEALHINPLYEKAKNNKKLALEMQKKL